MACVAIMWIGGDAGTALQTGAAETTVESGHYVLSAMPKGPMYHHASYPQNCLDYDSARVRKCTFGDKQNISQYFQQPCYPR
jgi:hypothetical protein